jgi:hypothetical protein
MIGEELMESVSALLTFEVIFEFSGFPQREFPTRPNQFPRSELCGPFALPCIVLREPAQNIF